METHFKPARYAFAISLLLLGWQWPGLAQADIFAFTDADGTTHLSNVPSDNHYKVILRTPKENANNTSPAPPAATRGAAVIAPQWRTHFNSIIQNAAQANNIDANLLHAVISAESAYNPRALSPKGAKGLMQLMPQTASRYGVTDPFDPVQNIMAGAHYLHDLLIRFDNNLKLALAAYNAGENAVAKNGNAIPPYPETQNYVPRVVNYYTRYLQTPPPTQ